jgi:calcium-dependent protein kinase
VPQAQAAVAVSQPLNLGESSVVPCLGYQAGIEEKYKFDREVGKGGNGIVRVVVNRETGEEFACKSICKVLTDASEKKKQGHLDR